MSLSKEAWAKFGAYESPYSGNGMEFFPLSVAPDQSGVILHESGYMAARPYWNYPNVLSPFWRLYYDLKSGHKVVFPNKEIILGPDRLVLIPDHSLFHASGIEPMPKFWLTFNCAHRPDPGLDIPVELKPSAIELMIINELIALFQPRRPEKNRTPIFHYSMALLHEVLGRPEIKWLAEKPAPVSRAIDYIENNYAQPLYNRNLAQLNGLSETVFNRIFRKHQGVSPAQFIAQVRVRKAARLLLTSALTIDDIAEKCGFPNRAYFTRVFIRIAGESPARLRRMRGGNRY